MTAPLVRNPLKSENGGGGGVRSSDKPEWEPRAKEMLAAIDIAKLLAVERATVEK